MLLRLRFPLFAVNLVVLALALTALARPPATEVDQAYLDEPLAGPGNWFDSQRSVGADRSAYGRAIADSRRLERKTEKEDPALAAAEWTLLGPTNIGGRANDVVVDPIRTGDGPGSPSVVYAATASGGVWRSGDAGETWSVAWPDDVTQAIGALAIGSDGVLYAGTGEANPGGGSIVYGGTGMYRSSDGGDTWERVGLETSGAFGRIMVHPTDPSTVFAAASGNLFVPGGERGLYRSTDGGTTWELVLAGQNDTTGAVDIAIDPHNPDIMLAGMWDHHRTINHRIYGGPGSGVWRSTDGGDTWTEMSDINLVLENAQGELVDETGRIGVAFSPADPSRAYAMIANRLNGTHGAFYRSDDGGATWTEMPVNSTLRANNSSYGWWFGRIYPDPDEVDRVFVTGLEMMASEDGGESFVQMGNTLAGVVTGAHQVNVHADQHGMAWDPRSPERVYVANDGGIYRSDADGQIGTWRNAVAQGWTQHYSVDVSEQAPDYVISGLQDNMCQRSFAVDDGAASKMAWTKVGICGDGLQTLIHPTNPAITFACSQYGGCARQVAGVGSLGGLDPTMNKPANQRWGWFSPLEFTPGNPDVMYWGSNFVNRSTDNGRTWTTITPNLADPEGELEQTDPNPGYRLRGVVTAIGVGHNDTNVVYAGTDNGRLWVTSNADAGANAEWTELTANLGITENDWITRVTVDPTDADVVHVAFSGYRAGSDAPHVMRTVDGGATWTDLTGDLPLGPVNDVIQVPGAIVAATDVGVFLSRTDGEWFRLGSNLPTVPVLDLRFHEATSSVTAATFGHGVQRVTLP